MTKFIDSLSDYELLIYFEKYSQKYKNMLAEYNAGNVSSKAAQKYLTLREFFFSELSVRLGGPRTVRSYCHKCFRITWQTDAEPEAHYLECGPKLYVKNWKDYLLHCDDTPFYIIGYPVWGEWKANLKKTIEHILRVGEFNEDKTTITWYDISDVIMPVGGL